MSDHNEVQASAELAGDIAAQAAENAVENAVADVESELAEANARADEAEHTAEAIAEAAIESERGRRVAELEGENEWLRNEVDRLSGQTEMMASEMSILSTRLTALEVPTPSTPIPSQEATELPVTQEAAEILDQTTSLADPVDANAEDPPEAVAVVAVRKKRRWM